MGKKKIVLAISGISGSGKSFIEKKLTDSNGVKIGNEIFKYVKQKQLTTRKPRNSSEVHEKLYWFVNNDEYDFYKSELIARTDVNGYRYGTLDKIKENQISTIVVNRIGYDALRKDLEEKYSPNEIEIISIQIINNDPDTEGRALRDLKSEKESLESITEYKIDNSSSTWKDNDIVERINKVIQELVENGGI